MNSVETIIALIRYKAPRNALPQDEHDRWHQYLNQSPSQRQQEDREIVAAFRELSRDEAKVLARYALACYDERLQTDIYLPCQLLTQIASFVDGGLQEVYGDILERGITFLPALYRGANAAAREALLIQILAFPRDDYDFGRRVDALAWIGDEVVQQHILHWRRNPPPWQSSRYVGFLYFETEAGWELTNEGHRRDLYYPQAYEIHPRDSIRLDETDLLIGIHAQQIAQCKWCGRDLDILFDLDLTDTRLCFLLVQGTRLRIAFCPQCSAYKRLYTDIDFDGQVCWSQENEPLQENNDYATWVPMSLMGRALILGSQRRTPFELQGALFSSSRSHLGGAPLWVQWAEFPRCPSCNHRMMYLGQVETTDVIDRGEGVTYGFICAECRKATTVFQQT